jgi:hypothetical protein
MPKQHAGTIEYGGYGDGKPTEGSRKEKTGAWGEVAVWQTLSAGDGRHQSIICVEIIKLTLPIHIPLSHRQKKTGIIHVCPMFIITDKVQNTGTRPTLTIDE